MALKIPYYWSFKKTISKIKRITKFEVNPWFRLFNPNHHTCHNHKTSPPRQVTTWAPIQPWIVTAINIIIKIHMISYYSNSVSSLQFKVWSSREFIIIVTIWKLLKSSSDLFAKQKHFWWISFNPKYDWFRTVSITLQFGLILV